MADSVPLCVFRCRYGFTAFGSVFGIIVRFENKDALQICLRGGIRADNSFLHTEFCHF